MRWLSVLGVMLALAWATGCHVSTGEPSEAQARILGPDMVAAFKALDRFKPDEDFRSEKEFEAVKALAVARAQQKDKAFLATLFELGEEGYANTRKASNELLGIVVTEYLRGDWPDRDFFEQKAIQGVADSKERDFRDACWAFLANTGEPERVTPRVLKAFKTSKHASMRLEIIQKIARSPRQAFIVNNEGTLTDIGCGLASDKDETPEMRVAAIQLVAQAGTASQLDLMETLKDDPDTKVSQAALQAIGELRRKR